MILAVVNRRKPRVHKDWLTRKVIRCINVEILNWDCCYLFFCHGNSKRLLFTVDGCEVHFAPCKHPREEFDSQPWDPPSLILRVDQIRRKPLACGSKLKSQDYAGFSLWFHLPRCEFGRTGFRPQRFGKRRFLYDGWHMSIFYPVFTGYALGTLLSMCFLFPLGCQRESDIEPNWPLQWITQSSTSFLCFFFFFSGIRLEPFPHNLTHVALRRLQLLHRLPQTRGGQPRAPHGAARVSEGSRELGQGGRLGAKTGRFGCLNGSTARQTSRNVGRDWQHLQV